MNRLVALKGQDAAKAVVPSDDIGGCLSSVWAGQLLTAASHSKGHWDGMRVQAQAAAGVWRTAGAD